MRRCLLITKSPTTAARFRPIASDAGIEIVVAQYALTDEGHPHLDLLVLDLAGADQAFDACSRALKNGLANVVAFLGPADYDGVRQTLECGATGFLCLDSDRCFLEAALRALLNGHTVLDPQVTSKLLATLLTEAAEDESLSNRELDVLRLVAEGEPNKRIARHLALSEHTVKTYLDRAYRKLGCRSRSEAAAIVARRGLL